MKYIVAGSRSITDRDWVFRVLDTLPISEVVCGMALHWLWHKDPLIGGPDRYGYEWAKSRGIPVACFEPDWVRYGNSAGTKRNTLMADYGDRLIAFWDGTSTGTRDMCKQMDQRNKPVRIETNDDDKMVWFE